MALFNANIVKKAMCDDTITQNFLLSARVYFWQRVACWAIMCECRKITVKHIYYYNVDLFVDFRQVIFVAKCHKLKPFMSQKTGDEITR